MAEIHAFDFLDDPQPDVPPITALLGKDRFLKRRSLTKIREAATEDGSAVEFPSSTPWRDVHDELCTLSLFGDGPRVVIVQDADEFVSAHRPELENLVEANPAGCLILDMQSLASNTRLYKALSNAGLLIDCNPPQSKRGKSSYLDESRLRKWILDWGKATHHVSLKRDACEELLGLVGPEIGLLDQELAKLALFVQPGEEATLELVQQVVGGWRAQTSWDLFDAALDGNADDAFLQLDRLLQAGEAAQAILGGLVWSLRRFANAAHLVIEAEASGRKISLGMAIEQAGFRNWQGARERAEKQLRQLGRDRAAALYDQLLRLDLSLKGSHASPARARWAIEHFLVTLSKSAKVA